MRSPTLMGEGGRGEAVQDPPQPSRLEQAARHPSSSAQGILTQRRAVGGMGPAPGLLLTAGL